MTRKADAGRRLQLKQNLARKLRSEATNAERRLWKCLRDKRLVPWRFRRQQPIGPYIVDFYCSAAKLIIELDGSQHGQPEAMAYDDARTRWLEDKGYRVLRIWNGDLLRDTDSALEYLWREIRQLHQPLPEARVALRPSLKGRVS